MRNVDMENDRFLTQRGANLPKGAVYNGARNRPVLLMKDGTVIPPKFLWGELEATCKLY